jgi:deoxyribodipyrimidine photo-lyase
MLILLFIGYFNMSVIVWFRHDLRLNDNPALFNACKIKLGVIGVYIHCESWVEKHNLAPIQLDFVRRHLQVLCRELLKLNIVLKIFKVKNSTEIPELLLELSKNFCASHLYFNAEYPLDEVNRDKDVYARLSNKGIQVKRFNDRTIVVPGQLLNNQAVPYKIFTAFKNKWLQVASALIADNNMIPLPKPEKQVALQLDVDTEEFFSIIKIELLQDSTHWEVGEKVAQKKLTNFIDQKISNYNAVRDFPSIDGTSVLSPYFAVGSLSIRQAIYEIILISQGKLESNSAGVQCWLSELIWREFYQHILVNFPQVCRHKPMQAHTDLFPWKSDAKLFNAWCQGKTGVPIVDAAMRQLLATGWMHNRLRMVVAMFLTKNLQIDWRLGEAFFMRHLIDGDFAANNGGWQWCASTGTDAAPYFRIFNPVSQSEKFDPDGAFIRHWLPELAKVPTKKIHAPGKVNDYPEPIVDVKKSRKATIELFATIQKQNRSL